MDEILEQYGLAAQARQRPDKVAIVADGGARRLTYAELDERINRAARELAGRGVGPGRRLGIALANRPEWMVLALAAARLGAQVVPIPVGATPDERKYLCTDGEVALLVDEATLPAVDAAIDARPADPIEGAPGDAVSLRAYTSGTTGRPKAVVRPEVPAALLIAGMVRSYSAYDLTGPDEVNLTGSPLHHLAGFSGPNCALMFGHTCVLLERFDPSAALAAIERERVTYWWCAPVHLHRLMRLPAAELAAADVSSMRRLLHGSSPCPAELKRAVIERFPPGSVWETYGGTETMGTVITPEEWLRKPGSVGRPAPGSEIRILDDDGRPLPPGEVGLVYIGSEWGRGFRYAGPDELTESVYRGDLATLGDLGYVDDDGYLFIVDRRKDMIITGGANVYPAEVEAVLRDHLEVVEAAVVSAPDPEYGEIVVAFVVLEPGSTLGPDAVRAHAREHLVGYKCPRRVEVVDELPRDPMGKVRKRQLRDELWATESRRI